MRYIHYLSDAALRIHFARGGRLIPVPETKRWHIDIATAQYCTPYRVDRHSATITEDGMAITAGIDGGTLAPGRLRLIYHADLRDALYPDGHRHITRAAETGIELTTYDTECCDTPIDIIIALDGEPVTEMPEPPGCGCNGGGESLPPATDDDISAAIDAAFDEVFPNPQ